MGPGQRAMAPVKSLSDVDSDSTCTQQQASGALLSPTAARHTLARRETLAGCALTLLLHASNGHSHYYTTVQSVLRTRLTTPAAVRDGYMST
jgi:hypothetical protein